MVGFMADMGAKRNRILAAVRVPVRPPNITMRRLRA